MEIRKICKIPKIMWKDFLHIFSWEYLKLYQILQQFCGPFQLVKNCQIRQESFSNEEQEMWALNAPNTDFCLYILAWVFWKAYTLPIWHHIDNENTWDFIHMLFLHKMFTEWKVI